MSGSGVQEALQNRHEERRGLARARLGARNDVEALQRERDDAALHGARLAPSEILNAARAAADRASRRSNAIGAGSNSDGS